MKKNRAPQRNPSPSPAPSGPSLKLFAVALVLLGLLAWHNTLGNGFVYDDEGSIVQNQAIHSVFPVTKFFDPETQSSKEEANRTSYRPLTTLAFAALYQINGLDPEVFHAANVAGHLADTLLLFYLLFLIFGSRWDAFLASAVFLLHPIQTETVAWVTCLANIDYLFFYLGAWLAFVLWESKKTPGLYAASLLSFVASLLCKEMAMSFPLVLAAYVYMKRRSTGNSPRAASLVPFFTVAIAYFGIRSMVLGQTAQAGYLAGGLAAQVLVMLQGFAEYMRMAVWPHPLSIEYLFPAASLDAATILCAALLAATVWAGIKLLPTRPKLGFGILLFLLALAPVSNIIPTLHFVNERHLYLSIAGWGLIVAGLVEEGARRAPRPQWVRAVALAALCALYVPLTLSRNADWRDSFSLAQADLRTTPNSPELHKLLARGYWDRQDWGDAIAEFLRALALEQGQPAADPYESYFGLGSAYIRKGDPKEAVSYLEKALALRPGDIQTENNLAVAYAYAGQTQKAVALLETILQTDPGNGFAKRNLARFTAGASSARR